jgi:hypothetical protein
MPALPKIERTSLTTGLAARYEAATSLGGASGNAKYAGSSRSFTNAINGTAVGIGGNDVHSAEFGRGGFTDAAKTYAKNVLRHDNTPYRG